MSHNFVLVNCDTDSIAICKQDGTEFSSEEATSLLSELNSIMPKLIHWDDDGYYERVLVLKSKNYCLRDFNGKTTTKGSALKASMKEPALKEFISRLVDLLLARAAPLSLRSLYEEYVSEIMSLKDINRWASKKTITEAVLNPERSTEQKILTALEGEEYSQGDKMFFYFRADDTLALATDWRGDHSVDRLLEKLYKTVVVFSSVLEINNFPNYKLKRNKKLLSPSPAVA